MKIMKRLIILTIGLLLAFSLIGEKAENLSIDQMRRVIAEKGLPFTVAENDVTAVPLTQLCGLVEPPDWREKGLFDGGINKGAKLPTSFDWRDTPGVVNPVKNQGSCGSCWAFGTVGSYEGTVAVAGGGLDNMSEEWLLDCNSLGYGCDGGWWAFSEFYNGVPLTSCYPYVGSESTCNSSCPKYHPMDDWYYVGPSSGVASTDDIKNAIYNYGPVAAAVYVDSYFQSYSSGIFSNTSTSQPNHAIILVGWDDSGGYWILRNSWAASWGENGYMRIEYGANNVGYAAAYGIPENVTPLPPVADFSGDPTTVAVGNNVSFTDLSTNSPTSWSWTFQGGTPSSSTAQNPTVTYNTIGTYTVSLTATNAVGNDTETKTAYITVQEQVIEYCESTSTNQNYEWIAGVQVADLDNDSGAAGYSDFTYLTADLTAGGSASVTLTPGFSGTTYTEYWKIWIDYNMDGDFTDSGEEVFSGSGSSTVSGSFNVPSGITGETRMRVTMKYSGAPTSCETFTYGEVEDYTVYIQEGTVNPPAANFSGSPTTVSEGSSVNFTDLSTNNPTSWSWTFEGGTPSSSTAENPTVTYNTAGTYNVTLTVTNSAGNDTETKYDYITVTSAPADDIADAVDNGSLTFTQSGNANWEYVTDVYYYDGDSAESGNISDNQSSTIETSVTVGSTKAVKFYWKVSSETNYDYLRFYIDGVEQTQISGTVNWAQVSYNIAAGTHTLKWSFTKDVSVSSGSDCGWVDKVEIGDAAADPIGEAVDAPSQVFSLSGNASWFSQTGTTYYGGDAAQSGDIGNSQTSTMETTISGKTSVKFYWRVSSESNYDYLRFYIDGVEQTSISGTVGWTQRTYSVSTGTHTLKWSFTKDYSVSSGSDCGWVDKLELQ